MKKTFYEKVGRRYKPVYEYDQTLMDAMPKGTHMIQVYPGGRITRYNIDPNYAAMIAAGRVAEEKISDAIRKASDMRPRKTPLTEGQIRAWKKLSKEFGDEIHSLEWPSAREASEAAVKAMMEEADKLMTNPAVRKAFDYFQMVCDLTREPQPNDK
jgi:hypothetical protein